MMSHILQVNATLDFKSDDKLATMGRKDLTLSTKDYETSMEMKGKGDTLPTVATN